MSSIVTVCQNPKVNCQFEFPHLVLDPSLSIEVLDFLSGYFESESISNQYQNKVSFKLDENGSLVSHWELYNAKTNCLQEQIQNFVQACFDKVFPMNSRPLFDLVCTTSPYNTTCEGSFKLIDGNQFEDYYYYYQSLSNNFAIYTNLEEKEPIYQTFANRLKYEERVNSARAKSFHIESASIRDSFIFSNETYGNIGSIGLASYYKGSKYYKGDPKLLEVALDSISNKSN